MVVNPIYTNDTDNSVLLSVAANPQYGTREDVTMTQAAAYEDIEDFPKRRKGMDCKSAVLL